MSKMERDETRPVDYEALVAGFQVAHGEAMAASDSALAEVRDFGQRVPDALNMPGYNYKLGEVTGRRELLSQIGAMLLQADGTKLEDQLTAFLATEEASVEADVETGDES